MTTPSASPMTRILMMAFLTLTLVFAGLWMRELRQSLSIVQAADVRVQQTAALEANLKEQARMLGEQRSQLRHFAALIDVLASPLSRHWSLNSETTTTGTATSGSSQQPDGRLVLEGGRLAVFAYHLPEESSEQAYQVWMDDAAGTPRSLGLLPRDPDGKRVLFTTATSTGGPIPAKSDSTRPPAAPPPSSAEPLPETLRVTLEPRLGSPLPTGSVVLRVQAR